jgi:Flp pilus assembly protein TadD
MAVLVLTLILAHFLSVLPFFIAGRYRLPVTPFLILLGGDALARLARWAVTPAQRRRAVMGAVAGAALYGAACLPLVSYTPSLATWHYHRGVALADAGKSGPAVLEFRQAVQADQNNGPAWLRLGFSCAATGDAAGALEAYTNAAIASPDNPLAHNNLGWELQKAGRTGNARKEFERALELDPGLEIAAINLGNLLVEAGERNKAVAVYEQLLQKNPRASQARKNLEALKEQISPSNNRANKQAQE